MEYKVKLTNPETLKRIEKYRKKYEISKATFLKQAVVSFINKE